MHHSVYRIIVHDLYSSDQSDKDDEDMSRIVFTDVSVKLVIRKVILPYIVALLMVLFLEPRLE